MAKRTLFPPYAYIVQVIADGVTNMQELARLLNSGAGIESEEVKRALREAAFPVFSCSILRNIEISKQERADKKETDFAYVMRILEETRDKLSQIKLNQAKIDLPLIGVINQTIQALLER